MGPNQSIEITFTKVTRTPRECFSREAKKWMPALACAIQELDVYLPKIVLTELSR